MEEKYTYEDWENGNVNLDCESTLSDKNEKILLVNYNSFHANDVDKIKNRKKEIFDFELNKHKSNLINQFQERIKNSKMKKEFLYEEKKTCSDFLFNRNFLHQEGKIIWIGDWSLAIEKFIVEHIQFYVKDTIKGGRDFSPDFIHSPNSKYKPNLPFQLTAHIFFEYYVFLREYNSDELEKEKSNTEETLEEEFKKHQHVFIGINSYLYFKEMVEYIVQKKNNRSYSIVYYQLLKKEFLSIKDTASKKQFCDVIDSLYNYTIEPHELKKPRNLDSKNQIFKTRLEKMQNTKYK